MGIKVSNSFRSIIIFIFLLFFSSTCYAEDKPVNESLDAKVKKFLQGHEYGWRDMNVPEVDGQKLYDLIIKGNYKRAIEIGTSTGHSSIWMAWALSKTGGKLITIEIDEQRYNEALSNFKKAGLSDYIDARLADAHELVKKIDGSFDFVFSDADKEWYKNYFIDLDPKIKIGGCFTAHNVSESAWGRGQRGTRAFTEHIKSLDRYKTTFFTDGSGLSISYKLR